MTTIYFYGDSWPNGHELDYTNLFPTLQHPYPVLVGEMLGVESVNCAVSGTTQLEMLPHMLESKIQPGDIAVFSLTSPSRRFFYEPHYDDPTKPLIEWDFTLTTVNDFNDVWMAGLSVYVLYMWCKDHQVTPYFFNSFTTSYNTEFHHNIWNEIPDDVWLLPKDTCVARELFDPAWYKQWDTLRNGDYADWLDTNNEQVQRYIRPCKDHPNPEGHRIIAEMIVKGIRGTF
jgi:hypothetical protein